jgi:hypothetical protein
MRRVGMSRLRPKGFFLAALLLALLVSAAGVAGAGVPILNGWANTLSTTGSSPQSFTYTISTGTNRLLLVAITTKYGSTATRTYSATYGGKPLTLVAQYSTGRDNTWLGYLTEAGIASRSDDTLQVTYSGGPTNTKVFVASYQNVNQSSPIADAKGNGNNYAINRSVSYGRNVTIAADGQLVYVAHNGTSTAVHTQPSGYTELLENAVNTFSVSVGHRNSTLAGSENATVTFSASGRVSIVAASLNAAPSSGCTALGPTVSITPTAQAITANGGSASYSVTVKNNDSGTTCTDVSYTLSATDSNAASFNGSALGSTSVTVAPGATSPAVALTVSAKSGQTSGTDATTVLASATGHTNGSGAVTTTLNVPTCTVNAPTLSITPPSQTITTNGGSAAYTVNVKNNDSGSACTSTVFSFTLLDSDSSGANFTVPSVLSSGSATLAAGASTNVTMTVQARTGATTGTNTTSVSGSATSHATGISNTVTTTVGSPSASYTIWPAATVPTLADGGADSPVELGVKFKADSNGYITGIRFYKASTNTGTHVGNLWTSGGALLATATFTGETASGWQQVLFSSPVAVTANTVYVASYHANNGHYSADVNYFATKGVDSPPLHALANGVSGGNGVYAYGSGSSFPNQTWSTANYWVDVVFTSAAPVGLTSIAVTPASQTIPAGATQQFTATGTYADGSTQNLTTQVAWASSNVLVATVNSAGLATTIGAGTASITATLSGVTGNTTLTVQAAAALAVTTASLPGASQGISYSATLTASGGTPPYTWSISSGALPAGLSLSAGTGVISGIPTSAGTSSFVVKATDSSAVKQTATKALSITAGLPAPILIVSSTANPFSNYYGEILRAEGFNEFSLKDISTVTSTVLASYDVVIVGEMALTSSQVTMFSDWVNAGGHLVAMRPDKKLATLLGLTSSTSTLSNAYLLVDTTSGPGVGIVNQTIQFHGTADRYTLNGATKLATLYSTATASTTNPAVTLMSVGSSGGQAAAFTYDLARSVVYTRQGNPAWSGQERDGTSPIRSDDLFYGAASFDPQPDWIDLSKVAIPQADEQQRLLANLIVQMNLDSAPLPRFWYLPRNLLAAVVMTGDDHGNNGTAGRFDDYISMSPVGCSVANWECVRSTSYIYPSTPITNSKAATYVAAGFEVGLHVTTNCADWTPASLEAFYADQLRTWSAKYTSLPAPVTNRTHCISWSDYTTQPLVELAHGIGFDTNYYYWPPGWVNDRPGFFTGSGIPMRFADASGNLIDVFQAATQMTDESGQTYPYTMDTLLNRAIGPEGYYGVFTANMHTDAAVTAESDAVVYSALARGIPVVSARQMLTWLDGRDASTIAGLSWSGTTLSFSVSVGQGANGLTVLVPVPTGRTATGVTLNGGATTFTTTTIKGIQYVRFLAATGTCQVSFM